MNNFDKESVNTGVAVHQSHKEKANNKSEHGHHDSQSSKRHHSKHRKSGRGKRFRKLRWFIKKNRRAIIINGATIAACLVIFSALLIFIKYHDAANENDVSGLETVENQSISNSSASSLSIQVDIPFFVEEQYLVGSAVRAYLKSNLDKNVSEVIGEYREDGERLDIENPVTLTYMVSDIPIGYSVVKAEAEVSEDASFKYSTVYEMDSDKRSVDIYHLKTGMKYYYRITLFISGGSEVSVQGSFETAKTPRILNLDGVMNMRDIGGWETLSGRTIRQGLLYRGCELDGAVEPEYSIKTAGLNDMLAVLGVKTDMDLRDPSINIVAKDILGPNVKHIYYNAAMYSDILQERNNEMVRKIFSDLADPDVYPVYLHCTYGMDRTGTVCCLLEALLGMSEDDLMREYELSALFHGGVSSDLMEQFLTDLNEKEGATLEEKVEDYLLSIGVTQEEIDSIRAIFLPE